MKNFKDDLEGIVLGFIVVSVIFPCLVVLISEFI